MEIYCCGCKDKSERRLTNGADIYPHRKDLADLSFYKCGKCKNYVGCHNSRSKIKRPLGVIPTPEMRRARGIIHSIIDPIWYKKGNRERGRIYKFISEKLGYNYHTADTKSIEELREVWKIMKLYNG